MVRTIDTTANQIASVPEVKVYVSADIRGPWKVEKYLRLDRLRRASAPEIDEATFTYDYGSIIREDKVEFKPRLYSPLNVSGKFVKVVIESFPEVTWFGVFEVDARDAAGSRLSRDKPTGRQQLTAFGLLRLLDVTDVTSSVVRNGTGTSIFDQIVIGRGLPFNTDPGGAFIERGNRSDSKTSGVFVFSAEPRRKNVWTAWEAARYLLAKHHPKEIDGSPVAVWELTGDSEALSWYDIAVETDRRTVKQVLDELIPRRRGVGYRVEWDETARKIFVRTYTFARAKITLPNNQSLPKNADQVKLDFESAFDIGNSVLVNSAAQKFHRIVIEGQRRTTTCTLSFNPGYSQIVRDWTDDDETLYKTAATGEVDYPVTADIARRYQRNEDFRRGDLASFVWSKFRISSDWNRRVLNHDQSAPVDEYWAFPKTIETGPNIGKPRELYDAETNPEDVPQWIRGMRIENRLAILERADYSGSKIKEATYFEDIPGEIQPEHLPPLVFIKTFSGDTAPEHRWTQIEKLASTAKIEHTRRHWAGHLHLLDGDPKFEIKISGAPQHVLAAGEWTGTGTGDEHTDPHHHPDHIGGINYENMRATLCLRWDAAVTVEKSVQAAEPGEPERLLRIFIRDARLDYVAPKTVVQVKDGKLIRNDTGGFVRDDRPRMEAIARTAAEWYGRPRQALTFDFRQIRPVVELGQLVINIGENYVLEEVNSVITAITMDFLNVTTEIQTSFADLEFL